MVAILREQKRLGHDVAAILPSLDGDIAAELARDGIACHVAPVDVLSMRGNWRRGRAIFGLMRLLRRLRPDVVHSHILSAVVATRIAAWIADVPQRLSGNVAPLTLESDLLRPLEIGTAFCDTSTIASCNYTRELFLRHGLPKEKLELIYYAVDQRRHDPALADPTRVRRELGIPLDAPVVGNMAYFYSPAKSRILPRWQGRGLKGHDVLLRAVPHVLRSFPDAKFVLVGSGWGPQGVDLDYEHQLHELARSLGVAHAVLFPGERRDVPDTLAMFDVSVQCSLTDNLAGTVESLLMARAMVVSDIEGFADTVQHEETGLVVPVDDPVALADGIVRLLADRALGQRLGENGRRRMLERFTLARTVDDLERLLARRTARAEQHYRIARTITRAIAAPFRILPIVARVQFNRNAVAAGAKA